MSLFPLSVTYKAKGQKEEIVGTSGMSLEGEGVAGGVRRGPVLPDVLQLPTPYN